MSYPSSTSQPNLPLALTNLQSSGSGHQGGMNYPPSTSHPPPTVRAAGAQHLANQSQSIAISLELVETLHKSTESWLGQSSITAATDSSNRKQHTISSVASHASAEQTAVWLCWYMVAYICLDSQIFIHIRPCLSFLCQSFWKIKLSRASNKPCTALRFY